MKGKLTRRDALRTAAAGAMGAAALRLLPGDLTGGPGAAPEASTSPRMVGDGVARWVDPFIGTGGHGHTYPGATVPFGMAQVSPDSGNEGWDWCSGYNAADRVIAGFSHTHLSGTGIGDLCDLLVTPTLLPASGLPRDLRSPFSHDREQASPGYYAVTLLAHGIRAELTATGRGGLHRYTFPEPRTGERAAIVVDLGHAINWDEPTETELTLEGPASLTGSRRSHGWAADQRLFFAMRFSRPVVHHELREGDDASAAASRRGRALRGVLTFDAERQPLLVKVGLSAVDAEGARTNLDRELAGWDFDGVRRAAAAEWERALSVLQVDTPDDARRTVFYTALYHALLAPTLYSDGDGRYRGGDLAVHRADGFENYTTFSLWDTFRAAHPLLTLVQPRRVNDLCRSMMAFYRESGLLPVWPLMANETNTMIGYHAVPVLADAIAKGLTAIDPAEALQAMKRSALQDARGLRFYRPPVPTTLEKLSEDLERAGELKRIATIGAAQLAEAAANGVRAATGAQRAIASGYARSLSGATMAYLSPDPLAPSALVVRAKAGQAIEWESASPTPSPSPGRATAPARPRTFAWLTGIDADPLGRTFHLWVNGERWFSFRQPPSAERPAIDVRSANGARLRFVATHRDQWGDVFGYSFLTLPAGRGAPGPLRLRVTADDAGAESWYMVFERPLEDAVALDNEYALVDSGAGRRQVVRAQLLHTGAPAEALMRVAGAEPVRVRLSFGANTVFLPAPVVEAPAKVTVLIQVATSPRRTITFALRPVRPYGYIPADRENESVSKTLEYAYDDACIARLAADLGETADSEEFGRRAGFYRNLFDHETGFMRGRLADGSWKTPFSPRFSSHRQDEYTEGNAWQYTWSVQHDVAGLIELMGGRERFVARLDELFDQSSVLEGGNASPDISGLIGQYAHGNEPSHHIAYLYAFAGMPGKTQARVRQITRTLYGTGRDGLCGNEDCGQLSAWYVFSVIGFYPVDPASGIYVIGSPHFDRVALDVGEGRLFTVVAPGAADRPHIRSATLNGKPLNRCWIRHAEILAGGELAFDMSAEPSHDWASAADAAPPSGLTAGE